MADEAPDETGKLRLRLESALVMVEFQPTTSAWRYARPAVEDDPPWKLLASFERLSGTIHTYPIRTSRSLSLLGPKYGLMNEIAFEGFFENLPTDADEVEGSLQRLPDQFYKQLEFGLGIKKPYWPLISALRRKGFRRLVITRTRRTALEDYTFVLAEREFTSVADEIDRIAARFSAQSSAERSRHAHNELLSRNFPERFSREERPYRSGNVASVLREARAALSGPDRNALIDHASAEAATLAKRSPKQLYKLQRDFELAGLNELIRRFKSDIDQKRPESHWQEVLKLNPFILSMLFGYPIVVVRDHAHVGGTLLDGSGDTIADFLVSNQSTQSLALVEIKRPDTPLTGKEFRAGRLNPSGELNSAVIQVIDQRYELLVNYTNRARDVGNVYAVDCVVVAGRTPADSDALASFEMYRTSLRDVRILTFDEILLKLCALRDYLTMAKTNAPSSAAKEALF